jgi:hypothetical protein
MAQYFLFSLKTIQGTYDDPNMPQNGQESSFVCFSKLFSMYFLFQVIGRSAGKKKPHGIT